MLYQLAEPHLVTYSPTPDHGYFSSTPAFVHEFGFAFEARHKEYCRTRLEEWFFPTVESGTWLSLVEDSSKLLN